MAQEQLGNTSPNVVPPLLSMLYHNEPVISQWATKVSPSNTLPSYSDLQAWLSQQDTKFISNQKAQSKQVLDIQTPLTLSTKSTAPIRKSAPRGSPHTCLTCSRSFTRRSDLKRHRQIHDQSRSKVFSCTHCDVAYYRKNELNRHLLV